MVSGRHILEIKIKSQKPTGVYRETRQPRTTPITAHTNNSCVSTVEAEVFRQYRACSCDIPPFISNEVANASTTASDMNCTSTILASFERSTLPLVGTLKAPVGGKNTTIAVATAMVTYSTTYQRWNKKKCKKKEGKIKKRNINEGRMEDEGRKEREGKKVKEGKTSRKEGPCRCFRPSPASDRAA